MGYYQVSRPIARRFLLVNMEYRCKKGQKHDLSYLGYSRLKDIIIWECYTCGELFAEKLKEIWPARN